MKTLIFLFFTYITYVLSSVDGPLGFAAKMPPFESLWHEKHSLRPQSISGLYDKRDLLLFLLGGHTGNCARYLRSVCEEIQEVYETAKYFGQGLEALCEDPDKACETYLKSKKELCNHDDGLEDYYGELEDYENTLGLAGYLDSTECRNIYTRCHLRSASCPPEYGARCRDALALCNDGYRRYGLWYTFIDLVGKPTDPKFEENLKDVCSKIYNLSDGFLQYCLNYKRLILDLKLFQEFKRFGLMDFKEYPELNAGALLEARGLDGNLFTPRTTSPLDSEYMMAFLIGRTHGYESFEDKCHDVSNKCLGLAFFSQTQYFCKPHSVLPKADSCGDTRKYIMKKEVPKLIKELSPLEETFGSSLSTSYGLKVDVETCLKYVAQCSYLRGLNLTLAKLCQDLESQCAQDLETGSALNIFELSMRDYLLSLIPLGKPDPCERGLREVCNEIANDTVDFLTFCLRPKYTCRSLRRLYHLRCEKLKKSFNNRHPTEKECKSSLHEYQVYSRICKSDNKYNNFAKLCKTRYPSNKIILSYVNGPAGKHTHHSKKLHTGRGDS